MCGASHARVWRVEWVMPPCRLKKKSPSERKVSDGLYFQNQKPEKRVRACGTHPTHESKNHRTTVGCVAQATHAFGGWNGLCRLRWLNADSVRDVRDACVRLRRLWAANRTYGAAFKAASDVGTISFVKTKRNRTHETHRTPKNQTSRLNSQVSDGL